MISSLFLALAASHAPLPSSAQPTRPPLQEEPVEVILPEPPRLLGPRRQQFMVATARMIGLVRFFHPSDQVTEADWSAFTLEALKRAEESTESSELARALNLLVRKVAPTASVGPVRKRAKKQRGGSEAALERGTHTAMVQYDGFAPSTELQSSGQVRVRTAVADDFELREPIEVDLGSAVALSLPLTVFSDSNGTLPRAADGDLDSFALPKGYPWTVEDRATRLALIVDIWTTLKHLGPNWSLSTRNWEKALPSALRAAADAPTVDDYRIVIERMLAYVSDGNLELHGLSADDGYLPFEYAAIGDAYYVGRTLPGCPVPRGSKLVEVGGLPVDYVFGVERIATSAGTEHHLSRRTLDRMARGPVGESLTVSYFASDSPYTKSYTAVEYGALLPQFGAAEASFELEPGVLYLDAARLQPADFEAALAASTASTAIIIDLRDGLGTERVEVVLAHLLDEPLVLRNLGVPQFHTPLAKDPEFRMLERVVAPHAQTFASKPYFLIDEGTSGAAELLAAAVADGELGTLVGRTTAGCAGVTNRLDCGELSVVFTTTRAFRADGAVLTGTGVEPDVAVELTVAALEAGRDVILEQALANASN